MKRVLQRGLVSRKWLAAMVGTGCAMVVFGATLLAVVWVPGEKVASVVALGNMALVFLGAISGGLITGQSLVDWRHGSLSQFVAVEEREERVFAPKHFDDEAVS